MAVLGLCLKPEGACSCLPLPCQSQARVLPAHRAPLSLRKAEAEGPPCQRPGTSLNPHSASTTSLFPGSTSGLFFLHSSEPDRAKPTSLGNVGAIWGCGALPPPNSESWPHPLAQLPVESLWSLPKKPCPLCCLLPVSPYNLSSPPVCI